MICKVLTSKKGFTLIELITFIIVGAIILPASFVAFTNAMKNFSRPDYYVKARFYTEQGIEIITRNAYAGVTVTPAPLVESLSGAYSRSSNICYVVPTAPDSCVSANPADEATYRYKKIHVSVTMPDGSIYDASTIVTKRPKATP